MFLPFIVTLFLLNSIGCNKLEDVSDDDLLHIIKSNEYVAVLFAKKDCDICDKYETQLLNLANDFKESLNTVLVRAFNSQLTRLYNPTMEPSLVFFRHGVPLLYDGPIHEDEIYRVFEENKIPTVKELSDDNFEHLTQASSGSTTGDWFVLFYTQECIECQRLSAIWEAVGAGLKNRVNVARINKDTTGKNTGKRFKIKKAPEFIFIRQGKFYRYDIPNYEIKSFVSFAQEFYRNARAEKTEVPSTPFDDLVMWSVQLLKTSKTYTMEMISNYPQHVYGIVCVVILVCVLLYILKRLINRFSSGKKTNEKKSKKQT